MGDERYLVAAGGREVVSGPEHVPSCVRLALAATDRRGRRVCRAVRRHGVEFRLYNLNTVL